jgi:hypothetical protein
LSTLTDELIDDATQIQQQTQDHEVEEVNRIIEEIKDLNDIDPHAILLGNALSDYFKKLEEIPTEDILNEDDIMRLIQEEMCDEIDDDSKEEELKLISPSEALKSLQTFITFFEQQHTNEFSIDDGHIFKKYISTVKRFELQS